MHFLRSILLPAVLCAAILTVGFFAPDIYGRVTPDFKDEPAPVEIAGSDSPIYIADSSSITLPPWDVIDTENAVPYSEFSGRLNADESRSTYINSLICAFVEPFIADAAPNMHTDFYSALQYDPGTGLLFLRDFRFAAPDLKHTLCAADLVFDEFGVVYYVHVLPVDKAPAPAEEPEKLVSDLYAVAEQCSHALDNLYKEQADYIPLANEIAQICSLIVHSQEGSGYQIPLANAFRWMGLMTMITDGTHDAMLIPMQDFLERAPLVNLEDVYTLDYENETLIVMTDRQNRPYTLFFDGAQNIVTGFSMSAGN